MVFYTSNSAYEVDMVRNRVRRLRGANDPSAHLGKDREWQEFAQISPIRQGLPVLIQWTSNVKSPPNTIPTTLTSPVERVSSEEN